MSPWEEDEIHQRYDRGEEITAKDVIDFYQLIPTTEPKPLNYNTWSMCSSNEHKWELWKGMPFAPDGVERDRVAIGLIYSMGLVHLLELLPDESKDTLRKLLGGV